VPLGAIVSRITRSLGEISGLSIAVPQSVPAGQKQNIEISSIGVCAGSGDSMLSDVVCHPWMENSTSHRLNYTLTRERLTLKS
jgi:hypothetical protein